MSLSIGIVGLPNVGKSTLFNALTRSKVLAANYPFATIEPNTGIVPVPDTRLDKLAELVKPEKVMPATVTFVDIAGLVAGAHKGEGLGNQFLAHIRETSAIAEVIRVFHDDDITHVANEINPANDIETIKTELILADLHTINNQLVRLKKQQKSDPAVKKKFEYLEKTQKILDAGQLLENTQINHELLSSINLLSTKPFIYVFNVDEKTLVDETKMNQLKNLVQPSQAVFICAQLEAELAELDKTEALELLKEYGLAHSGLQQLITASYNALGLQTYLTAGPKEVRAWTIHQGDKAPGAAGVIHGDFERGFIAAEITNFEKFVEAGSWQEARSKGWVRTEGKDYTMADGDVVEFRFNV